MSAFAAPGRLTGRLLGVEIQIFSASRAMTGVGCGNELFCGWHSMRPCGPYKRTLPALSACIAGRTQHAPYVSMSGPTMVSSAASVAEKEDCSAPSTFVQRKVFPTHCFVRMVSNGHGPCTMDRMNLQLLTELPTSAWIPPTVMATE